MRLNTMLLAALLVLAGCAAAGPPRPSPIVPMSSSCAMQNCP